MNYDSHRPQLDLVEQINRLLPQTQCGKCGFSGCAPYAKAIADGEPINKCPPGGERTIRLLADLMAQPVTVLDPAHGTHSPPRVAFIRETECIGCTKCIQACPVDAILGAPKLMHTVITRECTGCDLCVDPCPVDCIDMLPAAGQEQTDWQLRQLSDYRKKRFESRRQRLARDTAMRRGSRRRSVARPENPEVADAGLQAFSRNQARQEIAAAVARVKQRKQLQKPFFTVGSETSTEEDR
ncbi:MAG: electron transport complex subunit RsxB [Gammaproteobacteria bacterium]|jgi:electron transport complex protein RnfB